MRSIQLRGLISIEVAVHPPVVLGERRRYVAFSGGTFSGRDGLTGRVLEGGVDWQSIRPDGVLEIDAHYGLLTDAGASIEIRSTGLRRADPDVLERITRGEDVDPDTYYFRTHVRCTTFAPDLAWLNDLIAVSTGRRDRDRVRIDVHEVL